MQSTVRCRVTSCTVDVLMSMLVVRCLLQFLLMCYVQCRAHAKLSALQLLDKKAQRLHDESQGTISLPAGDPSSCYASLCSIMHLESCYASLWSIMYLEAAVYVTDITSQTMGSEGELAVAGQFDPEVCICNDPNDPDAKFRCPVVPQKKPECASLTFNLHVPNRYTLVVRSVSVKLQLRSMIDTRSGVMGP